MAVDWRETDTISIKKMIRMEEAMVLWLPIATIDGYRLQAKWCYDCYRGKIICQSVLNRIAVAPAI